MRGVPVCWLGVGEELLEYLDEVRWGLELWQMAYVLKDVKSAARHGIVCAFAVADRDHRIVLSPDDQNGHGLSEVEAVTCMDGLATSADHGAHGSQERGTAVGIGERAVSTRDLGNVGVCV